MHTGLATSDIHSFSAAVTAPITVQVLRTRAERRAAGRGFRSRGTHGEGPDRLADGHLVELQEPFADRRRLHKVGQSTNELLCLGKQRTPSIESERGRSLGYRTT